MIKDYANNMNKPEVIAFHHRYQWLYDYVSNYTGVEATMTETVKVFNALRTAKVNGYELPKWLTDYYYNQMAFQSYKSFEFKFLSELSLKLKSGKFSRFCFRHSFI